MFWFFGYKECGILAPQLVLEPAPPALEGKISTAGLPGKFQLDTFYSVRFSSVAQSCPTLCAPMDHSTPGLLVHHQLLDLVQTHVHQVDDAIQPVHPLLSPSPPAFNLSQHQGLFK